MKPYKLWVSIQWSKRMKSSDVAHFIPMYNYSLLLVFVKWPRKSLLFFLITEEISKAK